ncbi:phosphotransferase [Xinfangfangia sp. CPCC 101601]|uniref:Phosphotransferase n=1 Tax=Pseudogemmobacter lacusdianii TaxID=3069608 RepID=A0ABU0VXM2_9RHOB|nr:phosphotransferase [Xinfangfangia sp. CPCC 101601]MDQ2066507.1 phosphotransferase [Xinfangfangia sp. CPCC 101601]
MIEELALEAAAHWGGNPVRLLRNRENAVFEMRLPSGERAALRLHRQGYQPDAAIRSELWWCAALAEKGVRVPAALPARDGQFLVTLSNGRAASVIEWIEGDALGEGGVPFATPLPQLLDQHHALGQLVRKLHDVTQGLTLPADFERPRWDLDGLTGETPFWGRFWEHPAASEAQRATLVRARAALRERLAPLNTVQLVHADVLRENVLVQGNSVCLIDFDDSGWGFPLYDLGTTMSQNLNEPARVEIRAALMAGYGTTDTDLVDTMTLARTCASVGWMMPRLEANDPVHARHIARAVGWAEQLAL